MVIFMLNNLKNENKTIYEKIEEKNKEINNLRDKNESLNKNIEKQNKEIDTIHNRFLNPPAFYF